MKTGICISNVSDTPGGQENVGTGRQGATGQAGYYKQRYELAVSRGMCPHCRKPAGPGGFVLCKDCREKSRGATAERRKFLKGMGFCVRCGCEKALPGRTLCYECTEKNSEAHAEYRAAHLSHEKEWHRQHRARLKEAGICTACRKREAREGRTECALCAEKHKKRSRALRVSKGVGISRSERPAYGMCYTCGAPIGEGERLCGACKEMTTANLRNSAPGREHPWRLDTEAMFAAYKARRVEG